MKKTKAECIIILIYILIIWKRHAYRKAISTIKSQTKQIETVHDVEDLPNIGQKIKAKIKEILETGKLRKAECLQV